MVLGSGDKTQGPSLLLYESQDLLNWKFISTLLSGNKDAPILPGSRMGWGRNFECPSFFNIKETAYIIAGIEENSTLSNRHAARYVLWLSGTLHMHSDGRPEFVVKNIGRLDHGILYAAHVFRGASNELIQLGWTDEDGNKMQEEQGFAGCLGLPRQLSQICLPVPRLLPSDLDLWEMNRTSNTMTTLGIRPANQTRLLRPGSLHYTLKKLSEVRSTNFEIKAHFSNILGTETLSFSVRQAPGDQEVTRVVVHLSKNRITIDRSRSSIDNGNPVLDSGPFELLNFGTAHEPLYEDLDLVIFVCRPSRPWRIFAGVFGPSRQQ
jgi:beta-fructofuranosidase